MADSKLHLAFAAFLALMAVVLHAPLYALLQLSLGDSRYSHIAAMPLVVACVVYCERKRVFARSGFCLRAGVPVLAAGIALYWAAKGDPALNALAIVAMLAAGFVSCYGLDAFRSAAFPFGLLLLLIPLPGSLLDAVSSVLQKGSAEASYRLLEAARVPVLRDGLRLSVPGLEIEVAAECSGIRSAFALLITGLLAGRILLRSPWSQALLALLTIPVAMFKNGFRIATLAWLASNVDESFLHGRLHHQGGIPFSTVALALLVPVLWALRKWESRRELAGSLQ